MPALPKRNPARRNRSSTRGILKAQQELVEPPQLPEPGDGILPWHPMTLGWWRDLWASPMAPEYDASDVHGLFALAVLVNAFWTEPSKELAAEIRLQRACFGLSPVDRRRLQWEIDRGDEAQEKTEARREAAKAAPAKRTRAKDPRTVLRSVS